MPDTPKHPVTVGDLLTIGPDRIRRPATIADLVSALRAEGMVAVENAFHLHAFIADAIWLAVSGDALESACELADLVLEVFGIPKVGDGASGYVTPFSHLGVLDEALGIEKVQP